MRSAATAFAPATIANVAVGFDVLGFALQGPGDRVTVARADDGNGEVVIEEVDGMPDLPRDSQCNTAAVALRAMQAELGLGYGYRVRLEKGIPLSSGLGGSAASAVGAVVAANALLNPPLPTERLLPWAITGEAAVSGAPHADNVAPCLYGGLCAVVPGATASTVPRVVELPVPDGLHCAAVRPHVQVETRAARAALASTVALADHVGQSARLCGFVAACFHGDIELIRRCLRDEIIEPQRAPQIPGFATVQQAALAAGALGCSIAGSGPTVFAWVESAAAAAIVASSMQQAFTAVGCDTDAWVSPLCATGAKIEEVR